MFNNLTMTQLETIKTKLDEKLREDKVMNIIMDDAILEIFERNKEGLYRVRRSEMSKEELRNIIKNNLPITVEEWKYFNDDAMLGIIYASKEYLEDLFFDFN